MAFGREARARELLESGRYAEAAGRFVAAGELAAAARAFLSAKDYYQAAVYYEKALKPLDAARLYRQLHLWEKAAELYTQAGDNLRAEMALEQLGKEQERGESRPADAAAPQPQPTPQEILWPDGEIWRAIRAGDRDAAVRIYLQDGTRSGWDLLAEAGSPEALQALAETLFQARDHAVAAEAFHKAGDILRSAQCLSLAGLNEEAAHYYYNLGHNAQAAQHLEKAQAWEQAAAIYVKDNLFLDAARCHERNDDPVKAAALYLKAKKPDLALPLLQSVAPAHRSFAQCRVLTGKILFQKGQKDLAITMLSPLLQGVPTTDDGFEVFYQVAIMMEQGGAVDRAREAFQRLQESRFGFKDVTERLGKLPASGATTPAPAAPVQPKAEAASPAADLSPLRDCSLLNQLSHEELRRICTIGKTAECRPGQVILRAGQVSPGLMVVLTGGITITPDPSNPVVAAGFLGPGDYVGLGCLFNGPPQSNALVAQKGTRLLLLPLGALESLLSAEPEMGMRFYRSVAEHLVQTLMAEKARTQRP